VLPPTLFLLLNLSFFAAPPPTALTRSALCRLLLLFHPAIVRLY
jgi:hypothetical protein